MSLDDKEDAEELTPADVADACREILDPIDPTVCDEIAASESVEDALFNATSALIGLAGMGEEEAEAFLREIGEDGE